MWCVMMLLCFACWLLVAGYWLVQWGCLFRPPVSLVCDGVSSASLKRRESTSEIRFSRYRVRDEGVQRAEVRSGRYGQFSGEPDYRVLQQDNHSSLVGVQSQHRRRTWRRFWRTEDPRTRMCCASTSTMYIWIHTYLGMYRIVYFLSSASSVSSTVHQPPGAALASTAAGLQRRRHFRSAYIQRNTECLRGCRGTVCDRRYLHFPGPGAAYLIAALLHCCITSSRHGKGS